MRRILGRDDGDGDRRPFTAHGEAGFAPEGFRDTEVGSQERRRLDDVWPGRIGVPKVGLQLWRQLHQFVRRQFEHPARVRRFPPGWRRDWLNGLTAQTTTFS